MSSPYEKRDVIETALRHWGQIGIDVPLSPQLIRLVDAVDDLVQGEFVSPNGLGDLLATVLAEGNDYSTIEWEFDTQFEDVNAKNRINFCSEICGEGK